MINVYINYPVPHIAVHRNKHDANVMKHHKINQRHIIINHLTIANVMSQFKNHEYIFRTKSGLNDMWLVIDLNDFDKEMDTVNEIVKLLGDRYSPLRGVKPNII